MLHGHSLRLPRGIKGGCEERNNGNVTNEFTEEGKRNLGEDRKRNEII